MRQAILLPHPLYAPCWLLAPQKAVAEPLRILNVLVKGHYADQTRDTKTKNQNDTSKHWGNSFLLAHHPTHEA